MPLWSLIEEGDFMLDRIVVKKVIGIKQCTKLLKSDEGKVLYVAKTLTL